MTGELAVTQVSALRLPPVPWRDPHTVSPTQLAEYIGILERACELNPQSADVQNDLADAYLANGQKDMAREHAQRVLSLLDSHAAPASSWSDTEQRRSEIRKSAEETLKKSSGKQ